MNETANLPASVPGAGPEDSTALGRRKAPGRLECDLGLLLGVAGLGASRLGQLWVAFDVFAQFTLQFLVVTIAFLVGRLMPRGRLLVAFVLLAGGIVGIGLWPQVAPRLAAAVEPIREGERILKVASFNSWYDSQTPDLVQAEVARLDADVITLVELSPHGRPALLAALKSQYPYQATCFDKLYCNLAILSKVPIVATDARVMWDGPPLITATLGPEAGGLIVYGVHTIRFPHSRAQFKQVNALAALVGSTPGRKLVMGDFNATPFSRIITSFGGQTGLARHTSLPSWPSRAGLPQVAIDHIFASPDMRVVEGEALGEPGGSDHYPVTLTLAVPTR